MYNVLPLFKSHYSIGKSVLTLEKPEDVNPTGPQSAIDICLKNSLDTLILVEDNMSGFLQAHLTCKELKLKLIYGVRLNVSTNIDEKTEESFTETSKYIIFAKNKSGYNRLIKIYSLAAKDGFYYKPRIDFKNLKKLWSNKDLILAAPFYDSFIYMNAFTYGECVTEFDFCDPIFFKEKNNLPFDDALSKRVTDFCKDKYEVFDAKSIYYNLKNDFSNYLTFRCISNRSTLNRPQFDHMSSDEFCFENWKEQNESHRPRR
jgi:DNA polymerase III alpha subunit